MVLPVAFESKVPGVRLALKVHKTSTTLNPAGAGVCIKNKYLGDVMRSILFAK